MATKQVNPDNPGQAQIFLNDLLLAAQSLSDFQAMALLRAINYEWEFGHAPSDERVWQRLCRPANWRQKDELAELAEQFDTLPFVEKMRHRRVERLEERQTRIEAAQKRQAKDEESQASDEKRQQASDEIDQQASGTSTTAKLNRVNKPTPEVSDAKPLSSSSSSSSSTSLKKKSPNGDRTKRPQREQAEKDTRQKHWGIQAIRSLTGYWPKKILWDEIIRTLGDAPDIDRLTDCFRAWCKVSNNAGNSTWYLEWFTEGIPQGRHDWNGRASPKLTITEINAANAAEATRRTLERMRND